LRSVSRPTQHRSVSTVLAGVLVRTLTLVVCGVLPVVSLYYVWTDAVAGSAVAPDFGYYYPTAEALLDGEPIYPQGPLEFTSGFVLEYVYPPLTAILVTPFTALSLDVASAVFCVLLFATLVASLALLGVRDWRCYGLAFVWPPVLDAVETGNITSFLVLGAALAWRFRSSALRAGASLGVALALKLVLWPLVVWLAVTRRWSAAAASVLVGVAVVVASWAVIGFEGLFEYPALLRELSELMEPESYSVYALGLDLGVPSPVARLLWLLVAVGALAGVAVVGRRGHDGASFVLAIAAALAWSPVVWIHYVALVLVAIAVAQPRLSAAWFVGLPMQLVVTTGAYNGSTFQTAAVLVLTALALALAFRAATGNEARPRVVAARPVVAPAG
jgi:hypothetical protein